MFKFLNKSIRFNFYSGVVKSGILWFICVSIFLFFLYSHPEETNIFTNILLPTILVGIVSYIVMTYSLANILELKLKNFKSKVINFFNPLIIAIFIVFLIIGGPALVIAGIIKISSLSEANKTTSLGTISTTQPVSVFQLWDKINDWQKKQGYQPYVKSTFLCDTADKFLDFATYWSDEYLKTNLKSYFNSSSYAWNFSVNRSPEDAILNYWINNQSTKKNLTDYYHYSCIRCKDDDCLQLFYNDTVKNVVPNGKNTNSITTEEWGVAKQISEHTFVQQVGHDVRMGTADEIYIALNNYRNTHGKSSLVWNNDLAIWASSRAQSFVNNNSLDEHAGFSSEAPSKGSQFGFYALSEGSSLIGKLEAVHYIEWILTGDAPHKETLLSDMWNTVGIGTASNDGFTYGIDVIYGKTK
ncbi:MAG: CAP domain-containing protein [Patescibacteria group bacterium]